MSPSVPLIATRPASSQDRVGNKTPKKPKTKRNGLTPTYKINGRTFACQGCKNGHRVSKCSHALHRPVHMTNDPGRPSADQKRHCDCPKGCQCNKNNCKCPRDCHCLQTMYLLVSVPVEEQEGGEEWKVDREVTTDMKGNLLSAAEIENRKNEKLRQQGRLRRASTLGAVQDRPVSQGLDPGWGSPASIETEPSAITSANTSNSSCCHMKRIRNQQLMTLFDNETAVPAAQTRPLCTCWPNCLCPFCPVHSNNQISQQWLPTVRYPEPVDQFYSTIQGPLGYTTSSVAPPLFTDTTIIQGPLGYTTPNVAPSPITSTAIVQHPLEYTPPSVAPPPIADTTIVQHPLEYAPPSVAPPLIADTTIVQRPLEYAPPSVAPPPIADTTIEDPLEAFDFFDLDMGYNFEDLEF